jgi:histidinol dehydrogenase
MKIIINPPKSQWPSLCERPQIELDFLESAVKNILVRIKNSGDQALKEITAQFDKVNLREMAVPSVEIEDAIKLVPQNLKEAIHAAARNIEKFHLAQKREVTYIETMPGVMCWRKGVPIEKIGIYIPGGSAPLFSTVLMLGIPAKLAGCGEVVLCTPPGMDGQLNPAILFAAHLVGITKIFKVGGAQAIGAMAYGTATIPSVHKVFGPGNQYVTKAKQIVNQEGIAIDMPAGPSEVMVMADDNANASFVAADLLSQAEHGPDSQVVLLTTSEEFIIKVKDEIATQLETLPRKEIATLALKSSIAVTLKTKDNLIAFANEYAPEHLIINTVDCDSLAEKIKNAGSIFLGPYTPESAGDYASGTNHTLPTNGFAKSYSGVSLESFLKYITFQRITKEGLHVLGPIVEVMAEAEQLSGHAQAVRIRL